MKIFYRGPVVWNLMLFILLSFAFLYLQEIFYNLTSILNKSLLLKFVEKNLLYIFVSLAAVISVYKMSHWSKILTRVIIFFTAFITIHNLTLEFSKIILVLLFFYLILFYYIFQFYLMDLKESFYNPGFKVNNLLSPMSKKINCELIDNKESKIYKGYLTNWSAEGCYIKLEHDDSSLLKIDELKLVFSDHEFTESAFLVSKDTALNACGIKFKQSSNKDLGWKHFYEIIEEMGYLPERLV